MADIADMYTVLNERDVPNGPALLNPQAFNPHEYGARVARVIKSHVDRAGTYCRILRKIAGHWRYDPEEGTKIGALAIELATRTEDLAPGCTSAVMAAFPATTNNAKFIAGQRLGCVIDHHPHCQLIKRPEPAPGGATPAR